MLVLVGLEEQVLSAAEDHCIVIVITVLCVTNVYNNKHKIHLSHQWFQDCTTDIQINNYTSTQLYLSDLLQ